MATIRKRGSHWEAQVRRRGLVPVSKSFFLKVDAEAWASVVESEITRGIFQDRAQLERYQFCDLLKRYALEITPQKKGAIAEGIQILALQRDAIAALVLPDLTAQRLAEWRDERLKVVSGSTVNRNLNLISHVFNIARKEWGIPAENPVPNIRRPKQSRGRRRRVSREEEQKLLAAFDVVDRDASGRLVSGARNPWIRPLVVVALETAMRRSELLSLCWDDVSLEDRVARLWDTKNGDQRDVPLSSRAAAELEGLPRDESGLVFPITGDAVKKAFVRGVERAELENLHFHDLRHEATTRLADKLDNVLELSAATGHRTLSMLQRYYHPRAKDLAKKLG